MDMKAPLSSLHDGVCSKKPLQWVVRPFGHTTHDTIAADPDIVADTTFCIVGNGEAGYLYLQDVRNTIEQYEQLGIQIDELPKMRKIW